MDVEEDWVGEPGDQLVWKLPFTVKDEDSVEWSARLTAFDGKVSLELFRFEPGKRIMRDIAAMGPAEAVEMAHRLRFAGHRDEVRWHGYVLEVTDEHLLLQPCKDALKAVIAAREAFPVNLGGIEPPTSPSPRERATAALQAEDESVQSAG